MVQLDGGEREEQRPHQVTAEGVVEEGGLRVGRREERVIRWVGGGGSSVGGEEGWVGGVEGGLAGLGY